MPSPDVLIVDRDPRERALVRLGLSREGFEVREAADGDEALRSLRESPPQLVISGIEAGTMDGFQLCETLRRGDKTREIPFFILAHPHQESLRERARTAGAADFLICPQFVKDLGILSRLHAGKAAAETVFGGDLGQYRLHFLLRLVTSGSRNGVLRLLQDDGTFYFANGQIVDAAFGDLTAEAALLRSILVAKGPFQIDYGTSLEKGVFAFSARDVVDRLFPRVLRWDELVERLSPLSSVLTVDFAVLAKHVDGLPASVRAMVRLFDGRRDLEAAVVESAMDDLTALEVAVRLAELGVLRRAAPAAARPDAAPPTLFEPEPKAAMAELNELFPGGAEKAQALVEAAAQPAEGADWSSDLDALNTKLEKVDAPDATGGWSEVRVQNIALDTPPAPEAVAPLQLENVVVESSGNSEVAFFEGKTVAEVEEEFGSVQRSWTRIAMAAGAVVIGAAGVLFFSLRHRSEAPPVPEVAATTLAPAPVTPPPAVTATPAAPSPEEKAKEEAEVAAQAKLDEAAALVAEGKDLYVRGRPHEAIERLSRAVELEPEDVPARLLYALALYDGDQPGKAQEEATLVLQHDEKNTRAMLLLGTLAEDLGDMDTARGYFHRYLKIAPPGEQETEVKKLLKNIP